METYAATGSITVNYESVIQPAGSIDGIVATIGGTSSWGMYEMPCTDCTATMLVSTRSDRHIGGKDWMLPIYIY